MLKSDRSLYWVFAVVTTCSLLAGVVAGILLSGFEEGPPLQRWTLISFVFFASVLIGVIWLGLDWFRLSIGAASIIKRLKQRLNISPFALQDEKSFGFIKKLSKLLLKVPVCNKLEEVFTQFLEQEEEYKSRLASQLKDIDVKVQLAQKQKRNTEAIIYSLHDAVVVMDEFDRLMMANEAAGKLLGFDHRKAQYQSLENLICTDRKEFITLLRNSRQSKVEHKKKEIQMQLGEQTRFYDCIISCVRDEEGQVCGMVSVLHDMTREKEISKMKNDFVNHVSHELKTPLASITAYSEMLVDGEAKNEAMQEEFYGIIQSQAQRLNRLIENILNISRIESGLIKVEKVPVSLTILIEEQLQMIKSYAEEKNIKVTGQKPIIFDQVLVDKDMVSQVVVNLLSNAVKYTPSGGSVRIETQVDENKGVVCVTVTDTGTGISQEDIRHVFDKFYRVSANKEKAKGTGLGLNLVKQIVEKVHGGRVFVVSEVGVGSTFGFELPLAIANVQESV
ncbi:MAG: PAS domain-containing sensor histidine kinase [Planctomycetota bacterium]